VPGGLGLAFAASHQRSGLSVGQERSNPGVYTRRPIEVAVASADGTWFDRLS
jgi:hypothetical protein